jgi:hypothetical protein
MGGGNGQRKRPNCADYGEPPRAQLSTARHLRPFPANPQQSRPGVNQDVYPGIRNGSERWASGPSLAFAAGEVFDEGL